MPKHLMRLFFLSLLSTLMVLITSAQELATSRTETGYLFDHPAEWNVYTDPDFEAIVYFYDPSMSGLISIVDSRAAEGADTDEVLDLIIDDMPREERNNGDWEEPYEEYTLGDWEVVRASRVRLNDRLLEYFTIAMNEDILVFVRMSFRRGGEETYVPQIDAMISSVRPEEDEPQAVETEEAVTVNTCANTAGSSISFDNLTANFVFADYQIDYPEAWELSSNSDGSVRFLNREGATLFGTIQVQPHGENTAETTLSAVLSTEEAYGEIETVSLNGLPVARSYRDNSRGGTKDLAMAALRGDVIVIMLASSNSQDFAAYEPSLQAVFLSFRHTGEAITSSFTGIGARQGLSSAQIYGQPVCGEIAPAASAPSPQTSIALDATYTTENGSYRFNYPAGWTQDFDRGYVILSNHETYELFEPAGDEVQMMIFFADHIQDLNVDEFSPKSLLEFVIVNDPDVDYWSDTTEFSSLERRGAYADFDSSFTDWILRAYFVELDSDALIYVRLDMVAHDDDVAAFHDYALAILETMEIVQ